MSLTALVTPTEVDCWFLIPLALSRQAATTHTFVALLVMRLFNHEFSFHGDTPNLEIFAVVRANHCAQLFAPHSPSKVTRVIVGQAPTVDFLPCILLIRALVHANVAPVARGVMGKFIYIVFCTWTWCARHGHGVCFCKDLAFAQGHGVCANDGTERNSKRNLLRSIPM